MILWRLAPQRHAERLDGAGNREMGARWNSGRGRGVVYTSLNVATCVLESFVHFGPTLRMRLPSNYVLVQLQVPDNGGIFQITADQIPSSAGVPDEHGRTWYQRTGDAWLGRAQELVLIAPSAVVSHERNAMLDPSHPRMGEVRIVSTEPFRFDSRLAVRG